MRPLFPILFIIRLISVQAVLAANIGDTSRSAQGSDKAFYNIFLVPDTDYDATAAFIASTIGSSDSNPWTDLQNDLVSWGVYADSSQLVKLISYPGIKKVTTEFGASVNPPAASIATRADAKVSWMVFASDAENEAQLAETTRFLKALTGAEPTKHNGIAGGKPWFFWTVDMTEPQRADALKNPGISTIENNDEIEDFLIATPSGRPYDVPSKASKRAVAYTTQVNAVAELVSLSQPSTVPDISKLKNYVYESNQGQKSFVYHVEQGVEFLKYPAEFPNVAGLNEHILTPEAKQVGRTAGVDYNPDFHGTKTANKAVGKTYGSSKKATLVTVVMGGKLLAELVDAFEQLLLHFQARPDRRQVSVVTLSVGVTPARVPGQQARLDLLKQLIRDIMDLDVPVVAASGNFARDAKRNIVDTVPAMYAAEDYPLIVVGATNSKGERAAFSQTGPFVTTHAVGVDCTSLGPDGKPSVGRGTSLSAPLVAGELANLLSFDTVPFDTSNGNLAKNARNHIRTLAAGWPRKPGGPMMIWNGVTEANNPPQGAPPPPPTTGVTKRCSGLGDNRYVSRTSLPPIIKEQFCPEAVAQNRVDDGGFSILRLYNERTVDEVSLMIAFDKAVKPNITMEDCVRYFLDELTEGCDGNDPTGNPANYKGGGVLSVGPLTYRLDPQAQARQPASLGIRGSCDCTNNFVDYSYTIWGHGFANNDFGNEMLDQIKDCAPVKHDFQYGLGSDGREWTLTLKTLALQRKCVMAAVKEAGGPQDFTCLGKGPLDGGCLPGGN